MRGIKAVCITGLNPFWLIQSDSFRYNSKFTCIFSGFLRKLDQHFQVKNVLSGILKLFSSCGVRILVRGVKRFGGLWDGVSFNRLQWNQNLLNLKHIQHSTVKPILPEPCLIFASARRLSDVIGLAHQLRVLTALATPSAERTSQGALWIPSPLTRYVASNTDAQFAVVKEYEQQLISFKKGSTDKYPPHTCTSTRPFDGNLEIPACLSLLADTSKCNFRRIWAANTCWSFDKELVKQSSGTSVGQLDSKFIPMNMQSVCPSLLGRIKNWFWDFNCKIGINVFCYWIASNTWHTKCGQVPSGGRHLGSLC